MLSIQKTLRKVRGKSRFEDRIAHYEHAAVPEYTTTDSTHYREVLSPGARCISPELILKSLDCDDRPADELEYTRQSIQPSGQAVFGFASGGVFISVQAKSYDEAVKALTAFRDGSASNVCAVGYGSGFGHPLAQRLDEMKGVIREIGDTDVHVSLFRDDKEYCIDLPRAVFDVGGVDLLEDEGFFFWVERYADGTEKPVVQPLPTNELTSEDLKRIAKRAAELLDGE